jgi:hypothetical protein
MFSQRMLGLLKYTIVNFLVSGVITFVVRHVSSQQLILAGKTHSKFLEDDVFNHRLVCAAGGREDVQAGAGKSAMFDS